MAYCTLTYFKTLLPRSVTVGETTISTPVITTSKADSIVTRTAYRFINLAAQYIDSRLRPIYVCPIKRIKILEMDLTEDAVAANGFIKVTDSGAFNIDDVIRIKDDLNSDLYTINQIFDSDLNKIGVTPNLVNGYLLANNPIVYILRYPDLLQLINGQIAVGMAFDHLFSATQAPDLSAYGKSQRTQGSSGLDDILAGIIRLEGQDHTGRRFVRTSLRDTQSTTAEITHGRDKEA